MNRTTKLASLVLAALTAASGAAAAEVALTTTVYTASPTGFLVNSTLIQGEKEAILIDAQFSLADAHRLVAVIMESKKTLTTVYITHSHPDHYFGLNVIKQAFPKVKVVTLATSLGEIKKTWKGSVKQWGSMYGALVPTKPMLPAVQKAMTLTLEGATIEIRGTVQGDSSDNTYVWIPSTKTVITGDIVFAGVHPWTRETNPEKRKAWIKTLDDITALAPTTVIAGHKDPKAKDDLSAVKATKDYLIAFETAVSGSKSASEVETKMKAKYKDLQLDVILKLGAETQFAAPAAPATAPKK
ncbi:MAG: MBL fold metallo-hydrolase [Deltaproteobacteria bacterium]|nr:MBL fold metallo-hydrolase [Deltaproteobacteria bacterium]